MCVLSNRDIVGRVKDGSLVIEPFEPETSLGPDSYDLHLGGEYISFESVWKLESVDLAAQAGRNFLTGEIGLCVNHVDNLPVLVLRPGQVVIAHLHEYVKIPDDLVGYIDGKSKWARLGLQIASAGLVHVSWEGYPVLELVNLGNLPLKLTEGLAICQIFFYTLTSPALPTDELLILWKGE